MKASTHYQETTGHFIEKQTTSLNAMADALEEFLDNRVDNYELADLAVLFFHLKTDYQQLDAAVKRFYHLQNRMERGILPEKMERAGTDMVRVPEVARSFSVQEKMSATMVDKAAAFEWLRGLGQEEIIQETVNAGTLSSFCRNLMLNEGIEPPEDAVKTTTYKTIGINKYTPK